MSSLLWLIPALPLFGFLINGTVGKRLPKPLVGAIAIAGPAIGFILAIFAFLQVHEGAGALATYASWISTGPLKVGAGLQVDALSAVMVLNVTGVGSLIHLYSYGYMVDDAGFARFMAYLNLFMTSMLILVMGDSLPLLFVGWEGVGLCSYLLIGFWFDDLANVDAGRKAFIVNRVGDFAFLMGMFALFALAGTLGYSGLEAALGHADTAAVLTAGPFAGFTVGSVLTFAAASLFIGATGKSAQIPLYIWLPDAMAGPTPVSALIHAATMVTAGVYMVGRLDFVFIQAPAVLTAMVLVASATALLSGAIAFSQNDIKKVLAYSTVSQLGFMFAGMATTFWASGLFHVLTHAFFKALLFLGAGAVIHALHHEQDIRKMGGLRKDLPLVFGVFLIGSLALAGVPPFAGFWSKDEILGNVLYTALEGGNPIWFLSFGMLVLTALMTAFYTTRLVVLTFFGEPADPNRHPHTPPWQMMVPLYVLAVLSVVGGFALASPLEHFTEPVWSHLHVNEEMFHHAHQVALATSLVAVVLGIGSAWWLYSSGRARLEAFVDGPGHLIHKLSLNKFYVDEIYEWTVVKPTQFGADLLFWLVDRLLIDRIVVEGSGQLALALGAILRRGQTGALSIGTFAITGGTLAVLGVLLYLGVAHV